MIDVKDVLQVLASGFGAWLAIKVELRWMRADLKRLEEVTSDHANRIRTLEIGS